ncbi:MAG: adenine/guanine/hypoxanthine permease [Chthoniobacter sp.]|nr:adenine/guanine/hypoxanthine permease [Chthoniobacter sp.]
MTRALDRFFKLTEKKTTIRTELTAGLTTFAAMAYILAVNPQVLSAAGMDFGAVVTATALASAIMTAVFALATNWPIALAPGMGLNAFFAFTICVGLKIPWQAALAMVFCSGVGFLLLSLTGVRQRIIAAIPHELKIAISCGIGLFIAFIGLQKGGVIVANPATLVTAGTLGAPRVLLVLGGIALTAVLHHRRVKGAIVLSVIALTLAGLAIPAAGGGMLTQWPEQIVAAPASLAPTFLAFDFGYVFAHWREALPLVLTFLFVDLFDNMGTLIGVCARMGLLDKEGQLPGIGRALTADACAAMVGSALGTSTVTSYIESAAGAEEGGRTGLTALTVSACFLAALFVHPLLRIIPAEATAPALVIVGVLMMQSIAGLDLRDFAKAVPCVLTIALMPLTFSISEGLAIGFVIYAAFQLGAGRAREVSATAWILAALFLLQLVFR